MDVYKIIETTMKEFSTVEKEDIDFYISLSEPMISKKRYGKLYPQALAYLTAHKMKMNGLGKTIGTTGTIGDTIGLSSVTEGETSVSFSNSQMSNTGPDAEYGLTTYGMQYLQCRRSCIIPIVSAGVNLGS